jgi:hypothetical protein
MNRVMLLGLCACAPLLGGGGSAADALASMKWLAGDWAGDMGGGVFHAYYSTPEGGRILSYSRLVKDGQQKFHEFEVFELIDGKLTYTPHPGGVFRAKNRFRLADLKADQAVFENPAKDFPSRVTFHRKSPDRLVITLSEIEGRKTQVFDLQKR